MGRTRITVGLGATGAAALLASALVAGPVGASDEAAGTAVGLTQGGKRLVSFGLDLGERPAWIGGKVTGLQGDTKLIGIDYRVQDGKLYGVGDQGGVYTLSTTTSAATKVSQLTVPLDGSSFGVDFNPAADRVRIVSDTGQNLRHDVNPGGTTLVDGTLTYPPATTAAAGVTAAAYTNNDLDASTATTLFDLDTSLDQVALQSPANSGQLAGTGKLGIDAVADAGFDIHTDRSAGKATENHGYATLKANGRYGLFSVSLLTGEVDKIRSFPSGKAVTDLAIQLDR